MGRTKKDPWWVLNYHLDHAMKAAEKCGYFKISSLLNQAFIALMEETVNEESLVGSKEEPGEIPEPVHNQQQDGGDTTARAD